jgi:hypothetical protein
MHSERLEELVPLLEERLGLERGFLDRLDAEDENDWSFVIKLHALVEAAVSHLITTEMGRPELRALFARLDISNKTTGKAAFVKAMGLLDEPARRFMSSLSELRNDLVHDVRNVNFDLAAHVAAMNSDKQAQFLKNFNLLSTDVDDNVRNLFRHDPRQALWYAGMAFIGLVYLRIRPKVSH